MSTALIIEVYARHLCACVCVCTCAYSFYSDVDDVHDMLDDIQEQNELASEVSDALSQPVGFDQMVDEVMRT